MVAYKRQTVYISCVFELLSLSRVSSASAFLLLYSSGVVDSLFANSFGHISCDVYLLSSHHEFQDKCNHALKEVSGDSCNNCSQWTTSRGRDIDYSIAVMPKL